MYVCVVGGKKCCYVYIVCTLFDFKCIEQFFVCTFRKYFAYKRSIKKMLYNNARSLLTKIILYGRMFHSYLVNNFHELLRNNSNNKKIIILHFKSTH